MRPLTTLLRTQAWLATAIFAAVLQPSSQARAAVDPYVQAMHDAYYDIRIVPPVCRLGSNVVPIPAGNGDARNPMSVVSKRPNELLSRLYVPGDLVNISYDYSSVEQVPNLKEDGLFDRLRLQASKALIAMLQEARAQKIDLAIHSSFRAYAWQCVVFNKKMMKEFELDPELRKGDVASETAAVTRVNTRSAMPGASEHQLGTAVDLVTNIPGMGYKVEPEMDQTPAYAWLRKNAYRYGFVMSYPISPRGPKEPNDKTGYVYEPWHWRYIGVTAAATYRACEAQGVTTQDFLRNLKANPRFNCEGRK